MFFTMLAEDQCDNRSWHLLEWKGNHNKNRKNTSKLLVFNPLIISSGIWDGSFFSLRRNVKHTR